MLHCRREAIDPVLVQAGMETQMVLECGQHGRYRAGASLPLHEWDRSALREISDIRLDPSLSARAIA